MKKAQIKFTAKQQDIFLKHLAESANISESASEAGVARRTVYKFRDVRDAQAMLRHPEFAKAWEDAINIAVDMLEGEARRRAYRGVEKPVGWYQGVSGGTIHEYSDNLLMFLLKAHRPEKYKERSETIIHGDLTIIKQEPGYKGSKVVKKDTKKLK